MFAFFCRSRPLTTNLVIGSGSRGWQLPGIQTVRISFAGTRCCPRYLLRLFLWHIRPTLMTVIIEYRIHFVPLVMSISYFKIHPVPAPISVPRISTGLPLNFFRVDKLARLRSDVERQVGGRTTGDASINTAIPIR